jgi:hypothetical protein|eukprot:COSAG06_NODE_4935_length_3849_cov_14.543200_5_plen_188_part_00
MCYLALGVGLNWRAHGRPGSSHDDWWELLPHRQHWAHVHGLVRDGLTFSRAVVSTRGIPAGAGAGTRGMAGRKSGGGSEGGAAPLAEAGGPPTGHRRAERKSSKAEKKSKKSKKKGGGSSRSGGREDTPSSQAETMTEGLLAGSAAATGAAAGRAVGGAAGQLMEKKEKGSLHESQAKIKVVGINTV